MRVTRDFGWNARHGGVVTITMTLGEFREHVEWLEGYNDDDGCTRDLRAALDKLEPSGDGDET